MRRTYIKIFKSQNNLVHLLYHGNADEHAILQELQRIRFFENRSQSINFAVFRNFSPFSRNIPT